MTINHMNHAVFFLITTNLAFYSISNSLLNLNYLFLLYILLTFISDSHQKINGYFYNIKDNRKYLSL